jgi:hypothetical protein
LVLAWGASAWGQGETTASVDGTGAERARIEAIRQQKTSELDAEDAACTSRFAVNDCQRQVGIRRRQLLADLKRQETRLDAADRQKRSLDQLQRERDKATQDRQRRKEGAENTNKTTEADRQKTLDDKVREHQNQVKPAAHTGAGGKSTLVLDAPTIEKNRAAYQDKQRALEQRRQERDQKIRDHGGGGNPLPLEPP